VPGQRGGVGVEEGEVGENLLILQLRQGAPLVDSTLSEAVAHAAGEGHEGAKSENTEAHIPAPIVSRLASNPLIVSVERDARLEPGLPICRLAGD
jgi:hypothetical protein